jgi:hypothetical protein
MQRGNGPAGPALGKAEALPRVQGQPCPSYPEHPHRLVAVMVDHLHGDPPGFRHRERPALGAAERAPGIGVDLGLLLGQEREVSERLAAARKVTQS